MNIKAKTVSKKLTFNYYCSYNWLYQVNYFIKITLAYFANFSKYSVTKIIKQIKKNKKNIKLNDF